MSIADRLIGWTPFRAAWHGPEMRVDWCHFGAGRMTEPFFYETIAHAMRAPFNLTFQQRTSLAALAELPPGLAPSGFVFHMSRCGSTLISQALAAFEGNIVVSEAAPLRAALQAARSGRATPDQARSGFAALVNAYAQPRFSYETRVFVKFMAADVLDIALVRQAFPDVPWIFVTRDPAEIVASQEKITGVDLMRGQIAPALLGLGAEHVWSMDAIAYQAHVLAAFGRAALDAHPSGKGLILDYSDLPEALWTKIPAHFGFGVSPAAAEIMWQVSRRHSKAPGTPFSPQQDSNRANAAAFRPMTEPVTGAVMASLAGLRGPV